MPVESPYWIDATVTPPPTPTGSPGFDGSSCASTNRAWNAGWSYGRIVLTFARLSEIASIQTRFVRSAELAVSNTGKIVTGLEVLAQRRAQDAELVVDRLRRELVAQSGVDETDRLLVDVHVVAVGQRRVTGVLRRDAGLGRVTARHRAAQAVLEVDVLCEVTRGLRVRQVLGDDSLPRGEPVERRLDRLHREVEHAPPSADFFPTRPGP